jgi:hypothetical protein
MPVRPPLALRRSGASELPATALLLGRRPIDAAGMVLAVLLPT